ncbi:hypothetical protein ACFE04_024285 [Oxalis oulophora]
MASNMNVLLQNDNVLESFWIPTPTSNVHGSKSMVNFENIQQAIDKEENGDDDFDDCFNPPGKKRRLSATQVQFLEKSFEVENKLEPERKVQLAKDLGLQPRQVAIWFQNRRARYKNKQLEKDYDTLKASYDKLKVDYDSLLKEKEELKNKITSLKQKLVTNDGSKTDSEEPRNMTKDDDDDVTKNVGDLPMVMGCKQEDASSAKSDVFDSDSPRYTEGNELADSSHVLSDFSQDEDDNHLMSRSLLQQPFFLKVEDGYPSTSSCNFGFSVEEDQPFWTWNY